uniref:Uncharacterized protein n=1 Tax=Tanacetum cinerariifolium TaxID=118510 RepID=A0A6L2JPP4_TANCI|nr:hypothetical protein [Tanacetum cinerariifolium]
MSIRFHKPDCVRSERHDIVPIGELNGVLIAIVARLCGNERQRWHKGGGGGDERLFFESMPELDSAKMIIDVGKETNRAPFDLLDDEPKSHDIIWNMRDMRLLQELYPGQRAEEGDERNKESTGHGSTSEQSWNIWSKKYQNCVAMRDNVGIKEEEEEETKGSFLNPYPNWTVQR